MKRRKRRISIPPLPKKPKRHEKAGAGVIAIFNSLPVKAGAEDEVAGRFASSRGNVQGFPGFVSMEVLVSEGEVLVVTRWEDRAAFDAWVGSEDFKAAHSGPSAAELMTGRPKMTTYEVAVERRSESAG